MFPIWLGYPLDLGQNFPGGEDSIEGLGPDDPYIMNQIWQISLDSIAYLIGDLKALMADNFKFIASSPSSAGLKPHKQ